MFDSFDLIIFLIIVNIGFAMLITALFCYIIGGKIISGYRLARKNKLYQNLEDAFLVMMVENDPAPIKKILDSIRSRDLESFIEFVSVYLTNLKGDDFDKIVDVIYRSHLFKYLCDSTVSSDIDLKLYSIYCLGLIKKPTCIDNLLAALDDPNIFARMAAVASIAQTGCLDALGRVLESLSKERLVTSYKLSETLWLFGEEICPPLLDKLKKRDGKIIKIDEDDLLTAAVIDLLGHFKYFEAAGEIHTILKETRRNAIIKSCMDSLGKMVYSEAADDIIKHLDSPDAEVRLSAVKAVLELRAEDQTGKLKLMLNDPDWNVRYNSALALHEMNFDFPSYMFSPELAGQELSRAFRTIVHVLTEKSAAEQESN